jgi:predicted nucleic acid-binding protein
VSDVVARLESAGAIFLPFAVAAELRGGFVRGRRAMENERILQDFLARPRVMFLLPDQATTHHYARLYQQLRQQGTPIPQNDLWIAALVMQHELTLYTRDSHFDHLPQIPRI